MRGFLIVILFLILILGGADELPLPDHPEKGDFVSNLNKCRLSSDWCERHTQGIIDQAIRLANDYSTLLIPDVIQSIFQDAYFHVDPGSVLGMKFNHILGTLAFSQGDVSTAEKYWSSYNNSDLVCLRSLASQVIMKGNEEKRGLDLTVDYIDLLHSRFQDMLRSAADGQRYSLGSSSPWSGAYWHTLYLKFTTSVRDSVNSLYAKGSSLSQAPTFIIDPNDERPFAAERSELMFLDLLLNEAQGYIRSHTSTSDLALNIETMEGELNAAQRFRLAVGLAKLGLFDLSLRHIWLSATPWEAPLYLLRARLVFAPVQKNIRQLALAVDNFETQAEQILAQPPSQMQVPLMERVCDSPNEAALALQSLPLLHLAGYSSPRHSYTLGHSPVALNVLLSEVYCSICPVRGVPAHFGPYGTAAAAVVDKVDDADSLENGIAGLEHATISTNMDTGTVRGEEAELLSEQNRGAKKKRRKKRKSTHQANEHTHENVHGNDGTNVNETLQTRKYEESSRRDEQRGESSGTTTEPSASLSSFPTPSSPLVKIGVVSGSFDGVPGKITVGFVESIRRKMLHPLNVELIAMCFPTPRDDTTDRAGLVFDKHINLSPTNKTQAIHRIWQMAPDFVIFTDALLDSRVFALAHERLAAWQGALWGWGSTLGVNTIDYYFVSEPLWHGASMPRRARDGSGLEYGGSHASGMGKAQGCPMQRKRGPEGDLFIYGSSVGTGTGNTDAKLHRDAVDLPDDGQDSYVIYPPSELFSEQVVFLRGLPPLPVVVAARRAELWSVMRTKYFLPMPTRERSNHLHALHLYLFPGSVRHMHPEFDQALYILLKTDPAAMVVMAVPKSGRDNLPTVHTAVRHDLMHPAMPAAAAAKLKQRLRESLGSELCKRVRVLPPLEERIYHSLRRNVIAVLDPYPVGAHVAVLQAMKEGVPVVSAPGLQECTNSHAVGIARALRLSKFSWPTTAEEYAVEAIRLQREEALRLEFVPPDSLRTSFIPRPRSTSIQEGDNRNEKEFNSDMIEIVGDAPGEPSHGEQLASFVKSLVEAE